MNQAERTEFCEKVLVSTQKVRSILRESIGENLMTEKLLEDLHPWLFGEKCVLEGLSRALKAGPTKADVMNFTIIIDHTPSLGMELAIRYDMVTLPTLKEIFEGDD